jgi:CBS domain-containing protein
MIVDELEAREVMTRRFLAVAPEDTLGEVAERMAADNLGSALVVDVGRLVGIFTSRDVLRAVGARAHPGESRVHEWMTTGPTAAAVDTPASEAARMMLRGGFHHLPVVAEDDEPVGIVGLRTVVGAVGWPGC